MERTESNAACISVTVADNLAESGKVDMNCFDCEKETDGMDGTGKPVCKDCMEERRRKRIFGFRMEGGPFGTQVSSRQRTLSSWIGGKLGLLLRKARGK